MLKTELRNAGSCGSYGVAAVMAEVQRGSKNGVTVAVITQHTQNNLAIDLESIIDTKLA